MINNILNDLDKIDTLIQKQSTGTPREFAEKVGVSVRSLYEYFQLIKGLHAPILFCQKRQSYYYVTNHQLVMRFLPYLPLRKSKLNVRRRLRHNR